MAQQKLALKDNKNIALVYRLQTDEAVKLAKQLAEWLSKKGYKVFTAPQQNLIPGTTLIKTKAGLDKLGLVIVLGGDGTYLRAVRILESRQIPIVGINMGSLGFLTGNRAEDAFKVIEDTLQNKMVLRPRTMIHAQLRHKGKVKAEYHALNDIVIERGSGSHLINTCIYSEKYLVSRMKADGFIIATPTGSTAYNLAAGGPILHPEAGVFVVVAVAPHSLTSRPLIFPDHLPLTFNMEGNLQSGKEPGQIAQLIVDGQKEIEVTPMDEVVIQRSHFAHWVVRSPTHNYYSLLREKLKFGDRA